MARSHVLAVAVAAALVVLGVGVGSEAPAPLPVDMVGKWEGAATKVVAGTGITSLKVTLQIRADRTAEGAVGDTSFRHAVVKDQKWYSRAMNKADYVVEGNLEGAIVEARNIRPPGVLIYLHWESGRMTGSVDTVGQVDASQRVRVENLVLTKVKG